MAAYDRLLKALETGRLDWADRLFIDGNGRDQPVWGPALWAHPIPHEHRQKWPSGEDREALRRHHYATELWDTVRQNTPEAKRLDAYRLLDGHGVSCPPDLALALLWRAYDAPEEIAYWQAKGITLRDHRARLLRLLVPLTEWQSRSKEDAAFFWLLDDGMGVLREWERADPELMARPDQRGRFIRWMMAANRASTQQVSALLDAWADKSLVFEHHPEASSVMLEGVTLPLAMGSVLTDRAASLTAWVDRRLETWTQQQTLPTEKFWETWGRGEVLWQQLVARGADPHACDAQGQSAQQRCDASPGVAFVRAQQRNRALQARPVAPARPRYRA